MRLEPSENGAVVVQDVYTSRFGPKAVLGGDTYDAKETIKRLDWDETHRRWNDEISAWEIDYSAVDDLKAVLEEDGFQFGGLATELVEILEPIARKLETSKRTWWEGLGVRITVEYDSKRSGREMDKSGVIYGVDKTEGVVLFKRDDDTIMKIVGNDLHSSYSRYPFVGNINAIELEFPEPEDEAEQVKWDELAWHEKLEELEA